MEFTAEEDQKMIDLAKSGVPFAKWEFPGRDRKTLADHYDMLVARSQTEQFPLPPRTMTYHRYHAPRQPMEMSGYEERLDTPAPEGQSGSQQIKQLPAFKRHLSRH